nr:MAG TPA: hypothetical protein [Caudoviricetes sp.]
MLRVLICLLYDFPHDYQKGSLRTILGGCLSVK